MKQKHKVQNWSQYNQALVKRGNISFWIEQANTDDKWFHHNETTKTGRPFTYSSIAIQTCFVVRELFKLPLRQTEGLVSSLFKMANIDLPIPDYTTLSRRASKETIKLDAYQGQKNIHVAIDSTGVKVYGEGEWKMRIHGKDKRRTWRKVHISFDWESGMILEMKVTDSNVHDIKPIRDILPESADIKTVRGDGAYPLQEMYDLCAERGIKPIIPPRSGSALKKNPKKSPGIELRNQCIKEVWRSGGIIDWKKKSGYHKRSLAETGMFRYKRNFSGHVWGRKMSTQTYELRLRGKILNEMTKMGMPESYRVY